MGDIQEETYFYSKQGLNWTLQKSTGSFICEKTLLSNSSLSLVPSTLFRNTYSPMIWSQWKLWGCVCQIGHYQKSQEDLRILLYDIRTVCMSVIPQPANKCTSYIHTSQQVNRPVWTEHFLENSCSWNPILMLKTLHPCSL